MVPVREKSKMKHAKLHKMGEIRKSDGKIFLQYGKIKLKNGTTKPYEHWVTEEMFARYKKRQANYRLNNKDIIKRIGQEYQSKPEVKQRLKEYYKRKDVRQKINLRKIERKKSDPQYDLSIRVRNRILRALKAVGWKKHSTTKELIDCSFEFLKEHIESQFKEGMSWENRSSFHIDHIRPLASFDLTDPEQLKAACHWSNLQPLYPEENLRKSDKILTTK